MGVSLPRQPVGQAMCLPEEAAHRVSCDTWSWQVPGPVCGPPPAAQERNAALPHGARVRGDGSSWGLHTQPEGGRDRGPMVLPQAGGAGGKGALSSEREINRRLRPCQSPGHFMELPQQHLG